MTYVCADFDYSDELIDMVDKVIDELPEDDAT